MLLLRHSSNCREIKTDFTSFEKLTYKGKIIGFYNLALWTPLVKKFNFSILVSSRILSKRSTSKFVYS